MDRPPDIMKRNVVLAIAYLGWSLYLASLFLPVMEGGDWGPSTVLGFFVLVMGLILMPRLLAQPHALSDPDGALMILMILSNLFLWGTPSALLRKRRKHRLWFALLMLLLSFLNVMGSLLIMGRGEPLIGHYAWLGSFCLCTLALFVDRYAPRAHPSEKP